MLGRVDLLRNLAAQLSKPVVNDEPIGADEQEQPGRRLSNPAFFRALARRTSAAGLAGGTFHCEDGLPPHTCPARCSRPAPGRQLRAPLSAPSGLPATFP